MSITVSNLDQAGFILNAQKSRPEQQQVGTWLGFTLDLHEGRFMVTQEEVKRMVASVDTVLPCQTLCAWVLVVR